MDCDKIQFSRHAIRRMFERAIPSHRVIGIIDEGEPIIEYPDDTPYPSALLLGWDGECPLHVLVACDPDSRECVIVTCYRPDRESWSDDFKTRKTS